MLFLGVYMMPFYYSSKIHSIPGYLLLRFDEKTRLLNAASFAIMTVLMSGINLYLMALVFYVITSAVIGKILLDASLPPQRSFVVLPGGRANLVLHKLQKDPRLQQAVDAGWRFLKFRHLRRMAESPLLNRDNLDDQFALDPLTYTKPQIQRDAGRRPRRQERHCSIPGLRASGAQRFPGDQPVPR